MGSDGFLGVTIHKDVSEYEEKIYGGFTKRQVGGIALGAVLSFAAAFVFVGLLDWPWSVSSYPIALFGAPPVVLSLLRPEGLPPERFLRLLRDYLSSPQRLEFRSSADPLCDTFHGTRPDIDERTSR